MILQMSILMYLPTQLLHKLQWEALGGLKILHVTQYFNLIE